MFTVRSPVQWWREFRATGFAMPQQWLVDAFNGQATISGERVSVNGALAIADVFSAVNIVTSDISQCPLKVYRDLSQSPSNPGTGVVDAPDHRAWRMLHDWPFPGLPAHRYWATVAAHELLWGNWFLEKVRDPSDGLVSMLRLCDPSTAEIEWNWQTGAKRFWITRQSGERDGPFSDDEILHGFGLSKDGIVGLSRIQQARETIGLAQARTRWEGQVYGDHPYASGAITMQGRVNDAARIRENWRAIYGTTSKDRGGIAVLEEGATYTPIPMPLADMQFVESAQLSKTEIATLFGLPPSYLGGSTGDSLTYSTVEQNRIQKVTQAVAPVCNNIAQFLSHDFSIFPFQSWYAEFVLEGVMRGEPAARTAYYKGLKDAGVNLDPEYIAARENISQDALEEPAPVPAPLQLASQSDTSAVTDKIQTVSNG